MVMGVKIPMAFLLYDCEIGIKCFYDKTLWKETKVSLVSTDMVLFGLSR